MSKKVGVYVTNYCYREFLLWSLRSIWQQTKRPDFLLFIDDCSVDDSVQVLERELQRTGEKLDAFEVNAENLGTCKTINKAVDILVENGCDYVCGLSADDVMHPDYIKETYEALKKAPERVGWVYTNVRRFGDENQIDAHPEWNKELHDRVPFCHGSSLMKAEMLKSVGGFPEVEWQEDYEMFKRASAKGWMGLLVPKPLLWWRTHNLYRRTEYKNNSSELRKQLWEKNHANKEL
ncbi:MAG: glycosyltransferase family A protein [Gallionella sp.]|jgi:GT2 family glycosyltransferase